MGHGTNHVTVKIKDDLTEHLGASQVTRIISDQNLPTLVRQLALHANVRKFVKINCDFKIYISVISACIVDCKKHEQEGFVCFQLA